MQGAGPGQARGRERGHGGRDYLTERAEMALAEVLARSEELVIVNSDETNTINRIHCTTTAPRPPWPQYGHHQPLSSPPSCQSPAQHFSPKAHLPAAAYLSFSTSGRAYYLPHSYQYPAYLVTYGMACSKLYQRRRHHT